VQKEEDSAQGGNEKDNAPVMRQLQFRYPSAFVPVHSLKLTWVLTQTWPPSERQRKRFIRVHHNVLETSKVKRLKGQRFNHRADHDCTSHRYLIKNKKYNDM
jgi:hypothetical protein